ncbi:MAG: cytochrome c3 family protein [Deltaproteobacteria bacterium]
MKRLAIALVVVISACAGILGFTPAGPKAFPHRKHVLAGVPCTRCHANVAHDDGQTLHLPSEASCVECHTKPHDTRPCFACHVASAALGELVEARDHLRFDHARHAKADCVSCHIGISEGDERLRPPMATCFRCHAHDAARDARTCATCHRDLADSQTLPQSHLAHDGDWMREHGTRAASSGDSCQACHRDSFCAECHGVTVAVLPATAHFADPFAPSVHRAGFTARHALEARADPGKCTTCHQPERCAECHLARGVAGDGQRSPHPAGWVGLSASDNAHGRAARRDPTSCASCHDGAGQALCIGCHKVGAIGGSPHPAGWSSRVPLGALPCRLCHPIGSRP